MTERLIAGTIVLVLLIAGIMAMNAWRNERQPLLIDAAVPAQQVAPCAQLPNPCATMDCTPCRPTREIA